MAMAYEYCVANFTTTIGDKITKMMHGILNVWGTYDWISNRENAIATPNHATMQ